MAYKLSDSATGTSQMGSGTGFGSSQTTSNWKSNRVDPFYGYGALNQQGLEGLKGGEAYGQQNFGQALAGQNRALNAYEQMAAGQGPSLATAMMGQQTQQNIAAQQSMQAQAGGAGAFRNAALAGQAQQVAGAQNLAQIRAQEQQAAMQGAAGLSSQMAGQGLQQQLGYAGMLNQAQISQMQAAADFQLQQRALQEQERMGRMQRRMGWANFGVSTGGKVVEAIGSAVSMSDERVKTNIRPAGAGPGFDPAAFSNAPSAVPQMQPRTVMGRDDLASRQDNVMEAYAARSQGARQGLMGGAPASDGGSFGTNLAALTNLTGPTARPERRYGAESLGRTLDESGANIDRMQAEYDASNPFGVPGGSAEMESSSVGTGRSMGKSGGGGGGGMGGGMAMLGGMMGGGGSGGGGGMGGMMKGIGGAMSDERVKSGERVARSEVSELAGSLQPVSFEYQEGAGPAGHRVGVLAQQLEQTPAGAALVADTPRGKIVDTDQATLANMAIAAEQEQRLRRLEALALAPPGGGSTISQQKVRSA
jgi:hypothetical protein